VILFNTMLMGLDGYGIDEERAAVLLSLNMVCTVIFILEACLKLLAFSISGYCADAWNVFDLAVVAISLVDLAVEILLVESGSAIQPTLLRILRLTRILRTMRAIKSSRGLRMLLTTLFTSLPALANVFGVFLILQFTFSVLGMHLFRHVPWRGYADFCSFQGAFLTMFRCATGEGWNMLMHQAMDPTECSPDALERGDCGSWVAVPFFVSYVVLTSFVVLKMIVALIIENFVISLKQDESRIQYRHTSAFVKAWAARDPYGSGRINLAHLFGVLQQLPPPLGLDPKDFPNGKIRNSDYSRFILTLGLRAYRRAGDSPFVVFHEVLAALLDAAFGDVVAKMHEKTTEAEVLAHVSLTMKERLSRQASLHLTLSNGDDAASGGVETTDIARMYAVFLVERVWRGRTQRAAASLSA